MFGFFFLATQYLQFARGYSPLEAGLALLPLPVMFVVLSARSASLAARYGAARVCSLSVCWFQRSRIASVGFSVSPSVDELGTLLRPFKLRQPHFLIFLALRITTRSFVIGAKDRGFPQRFF